MDSLERHDMRDLQDSGFIPLMTFLNLDLKGNLDRSIAVEALLRTRSKLVSASEEIKFRRTVLEADTTAKRAILAEELEVMKGELSRWNNKELPRLRDEFKRDIQLKLNHPATLSTLPWVPRARFQKE
ncbi:MAG: hypothetical protein R3F31_03420 [Verrucomicrobiales bacterium]